MKPSCPSLLLSAALSASMYLTAPASALAGFAPLSPPTGSHPELLLSAAQTPAQDDLTITQTETPQGTQVVYTTSFTNNTQDNADVIDIVNPIPLDAVYLPNSATGLNCEITFSIDGGITWDKPENLLVTESGGNKRMATAHDYTHIRWVYGAGLAPKASSQVSFAVEYQ